MAKGPQGNEAGRAAFRQKTAEIVVAVLFLLIAAIVMVDSRRLGAKWDFDGPQAGYFPFYVGLIMFAAATANLLIAAFGKSFKDKPFVEVGQLALVLKVLVPAGLYVAAIVWTGIYVASTIFIAFFMRWLGKYPWWKVAAVSVGTSVVFFLIFEVWFKVPLPKGPLEAALGLL
jgi:putative tricarboxylic transport membrane protein